LPELSKDDVSIIGFSALSDTPSAVLSRRSCLLVRWLPSLIYHEYTVIDLDKTVIKPSPRVPMLLPLSSNVRYTPLTENSRSNRRTWVGVLNYAGIILSAALFVLAALHVTGIKRMIFPHDDGNNTLPKNNYFIQQQPRSLSRLLHQQPRSLTRCLHQQPRSLIRLLHQQLTSLC
jgi:hypothetical protein